MLSYTILASFSIAMIEILYKFDLKSKVDRFLAILTKAIRVILSDAISDHWKEQALLQYSLLLLKTSFSILAVFLIPFVFFLLASYIYKDLASYALSCEGFIVMICASFVYFLIRAKLS